MLSRDLGLLLLLIQLLKYAMSLAINIAERFVLCELLQDSLSSHYNVFLQKPLVYFYTFKLLAATRNAWSAINFNWLCLKRGVKLTIRPGNRNSCGILKPDAVVTKALKQKLDRAEMWPERLCWSSVTRDKLKVGEGLFHNGCLFSGAVTVARHWILQCK